MGNVQCCASGRFPVGKPPKKPKNKKKSKGLKGISKKNSVGSGKGNGAVQKGVTMAEDGSEKAAPAETLVQAAAPAGDVTDGLPLRQEENEMQQASDNSSGSNSPRSESMAAARERFFGQVLINMF